VTKIHTEVLDSMRKALETTVDPTERQRLQAMIEETESTMTLMGTISASSSKEYVDQIKQEVAESMRRIKALHGE
jgi:hypothetical protein